MRRQILARHFLTSLVMTTALLGFVGCADPMFLDVVTAPVVIYCAAKDAVHATATPKPTPNAQRPTSNE
jgi:hypothetical protein